MDTVELEKAAADDLPYEFDFTDWSALINSDALTSATVSGSPSGLTIGSPTISGKKVLARISGGVAGVTYQLTIQATTVAGYDIVGFVNLEVAAPPTP